MGTTDLPAPAVSDRPGKREQVRDIARRLVEDPTYVEQLQVRLREGLCGAMEPLLWRFAYGDPKIHHRQVNPGDEARWKAMRAGVAAMLREAPERAEQIDRLIQATAGETIDVEAQPVEEEGDGA